MSDDTQSEAGTAFGHETTQLLAVCMRKILQMIDGMIDEGMSARCRARNISPSRELRRESARNVWHAMLNMPRNAQVDFSNRVVGEISDLIKLYKESLLVFILAKFAAMPNAHLYNIKYAVPDIRTFLFRFITAAAREEVLQQGLKEMDISNQLVLVKTLLRLVFLEVVRDANCVISLKESEQPFLPPPISDFPQQQQLLQQPQQQQQITLPSAPVVDDGQDSADNSSVNVEKNPLIDTTNLVTLTKDSTPAQVAAALALATGDTARSVLNPPGSPTPVLTPASAPAPALAPATAPATAPVLTAPASPAPASPAPIPPPPPSPSTVVAATTTTATATTATEATNESKALSMTGGEAGSSATGSVITATATATSATASAPLTFSFATDVPGVSMLNLETEVQNAQQFAPPLPLAAPEAVAKYTVDGAGGVTDKDRQDTGLHLPLSDTSFGSEIKQIVTITPDQLKNVITMNTPTAPVQPNDSITSRLPGPVTIVTPVGPTTSG